MDEITLNCWVRSEEPHVIFQVKISNTATVYDLQNAIKDKRPGSFCGVDANYLTLYTHKALRSIPYEKLGKFILSEHGELLRGVYELSKFFPEPPPKYDIHVIVDAPSKVVCFFRRANLSDSFRLAIRPGEDPDDLICRIKDVRRDLWIVDNYLIRLYKISGDENELRECLGKTGAGELLQGRLMSKFLDVPVLDPLHVVIEVSTGPTPAISPASSLISSSIGEHHPTAVRKCDHDGISFDEERGKRYKADSSIVDDGPCYVNFGTPSLIREPWMPRPRRKPFTL